MNLGQSLQPTGLQLDLWSVLMSKMTKAILVILFLGLAPHLAAGQSIKILDAQNLEAIQNAYVYSDSVSAVSDFRGGVPYRLFEDSTLSGGLDILIAVQHASYQMKSLTLEQVKAAGFKIYLEESKLNLDEVVLSANRWEQDKHDIPIKIEQISLKETRLQNPQTAADMIGSSGEVYIQKSQMGGGSPMIRGFSTNRVLLVVDGVRMNTAIFREGNVQNVIALDPFATQNTEVIFGPGSVIYGSDAIGGVMDFHTLEAGTSPNELAYLYGHGAYRFSSANYEHTFHGDIRLKNDHWGFVTSFTQSKFGDLRMGSQGSDVLLRPTYQGRINGVDTVLTNSDPQRQVQSVYEQWNFMQKLIYEPGEDWDLTYSFHYSESSDVPRFDRLIETEEDDTFTSAEWYYGPQRWIMHHLKARLKKSTVIYDEARFTAAYQHFEESRHDRKWNRDVRRERFEEVNAYSLNADFEKSLSERHQLYYGGEYVFNRVESTGRGINIETNEVTPVNSRYPKGSSWKTGALYSSLEYTPSERLTLLTGLRINYVGLYAEFDTAAYPFPFSQLELNNNAWNGSFGIAFRPNELWQFNANVSSGFRAPNIDDTGKFFDSGHGVVIVPNTELRPEYAYNFDFIVSRKIAQKWKVEAAAFFTFLDDAMVRDEFTFNGQDSIFYDGELSKVFALQNAESATVYGFQLGLLGDLNRHWSIEVHYNYTRGETKNGDALRHVAPTFGDFHAVYQAKRFKGDLYAMFNGEMPWERLAPSEREKESIYQFDENGNLHSPSWYTLNFKAFYQIHPRVQLNAGVENIFDLRYRTYSSGIVAPGRNLIAALRVDF